MPVVTTAQLAKVLSLLLRKDTSRLEATVSAFSTQYPASDRFAVLCSVTAHLQVGRSLLNAEERLAAFFLFRALYPEQDITNNPFVAFLIEAACEESRTAAERIFILQLLTGQLDPQIALQTPRNVAACLPLSSRVNFPPADVLKKRLLPARFQEDGHAKQVQDAEQPAANFDALQLTRVIGSRHLGLPAAQPATPQDAAAAAKGPGHVLWCLPLPSLPLVAPEDSSSNGHSIIAAALEGPLLPNDQQKIIHEIQEDEQVLQRCRMDPAMLPPLVEHNPGIAAALLLRCLKGESAPDYLAVLVSMELSLHSLEVVSRLTSSLDLPQDFINHYIANCIASCDRAEDKMKQNRMVRLVCVFLHSLLRNNNVNLQDLFLEVQAFCISYSRVREAAALFRRLKALEAAEDGQLDAATAASLAGSESNVDSSSKDGGMAGADMATLSD
ncbi:g11215 [Coccomyxa viridis]|uniref:CCR4-NOT transcription complex subunit 11 n=1 Tax=Coccomyxa viridis TaxID=1274662 RepID=A0ABP1G7F7_9CHLO